MSSTQSALISTDVRQQLSAVIECIGDEIYEECFNHLMNIDHRSEFSDFDVKLIRRSAAFFSQLAVLVDQPTTSKRASKAAQAHKAMVQNFIETMNLLVAEHQANARTQMKQNALEDERKKEMQLLDEVFRGIGLKEQKSEEESADLKRQNKELKKKLQAARDTLKRTEIAHDEWANKASVKIEALQRDKFAGDAVVRHFKDLAEQRLKLVEETKTKLLRYQMESDQWASEMTFRQSQLEDELNAYKQNEDATDTCARTRPVNF